MSEGLTSLKDGLTFDLNSKEGLDLAIRYLGDNFSLIGIEEAFSGYIPKYSDGIGVFVDDNKIYKDYITVIMDSDKTRLETISLIIASLFNQSSIAIVKDRVVKFLDVLPISISDNMKDYLINSLVDIKPNLLALIRAKIDERSSSAI